MPCCVWYPCALNSGLVSVLLHACGELGSQFTCFTSTQKLGTRTVSTPRTCALVSGLVSATTCVRCVSLLATSLHHAPVGREAAACQRQEALVQPYLLLRQA